MSMGAKQVFFHSSHEKAIINDTLNICKTDDINIDCQKNTQLFTTVELSVR